MIITAGAAFINGGVRKIDFLDGFSVNFEPFAIGFWHEAKRRQFASTRFALRDERFAIIL